MKGRNVLYEGYRVTAVKRKTKSTKESETMKYGEKKTLKDVAINYKMK